MKRLTPICCSVLVLFVANVQTQRAATGAEPSEVLKKDVGSWDVKMKIWPQGPDGPAIESDCEEQGRMLGGQWLITDFKGALAGVTFEGHGTFGYDPEKKKYIGTWVDSMNPTLSLMEGDYDEKTKTMTMYSDGVDPNTGKKTKHQNVSKYLDDNKRTFTMSYLAPGSEDKYIKMMELSYTRKKSEK